MGKTEKIDTWEDSHKKSKKKKKKHKKEKKKDKKTSKEKILEREIKEIKQELDIKQERESGDDCGPSLSKRRKKIGNQVIDDIVIMDSEDEAFKPAGSKLTSDTLAQIDEILYADIGKVQKDDKAGKASNNLMSAVDKILGLSSLGEGTSRKGDDSIAATSEEEDSDSNQSSDEYSEGDDNIHSGRRTRRSSSDYGEDDSDSVEGSEEEEELSEGEMRLLNMIKINKIDVKLNFPKAYSDTACHFCREPEDSEHLAQCPVYSAVMRGTEFEDISQKNMQLLFPRE